MQSNTEYQAQGSASLTLGLPTLALDVMLLGIGLVQTHAGCMFLIGDCYQPTLPPWMFEIKAGANLYLTIVNALALTSAYLNTREISRLLNEKSRI